MLLFLKGRGKRVHSTEQNAACTWENLSRWWPGNQLFLFPASEVLCSAPCPWCTVNGRRLRTLLCLMIANFEGLFKSLRSISSWTSSQHWLMFREHHHNRHLRPTMRIQVFFIFEVKEQFCTFPLKFQILDCLYRICKWKVSFTKMAWHPGYQVGFRIVIWKAPVFGPSIARRAFLVFK